MNWPAFAKRLLLDDGRINQRETELLKRAILADHTVDRDEVEFLIDLKRSAVAVHADFDHFFYEVLHRVALRDGTISDGEAHWLRGILLANGTVNATEAQFLRDLKAQAKATGPAFDKLYRECLGA